MTLLIIYHVFQFFLFILLVSFFHEMTSKRKRSRSPSQEQEPKETDQDMLLNWIPILDLVDLVLRYRDFTPTLLQEAPDENKRNWYIDRVYQNKNQNFGEISYNLYMNNTLQFCLETLPYDNDSWTLVESYTFPQLKLKHPPSWKSSVIKQWLHFEYTNDEDETYYIYVIETEEELLSLNFGCDPWIIDSVKIMTSEQYMQQENPHQILGLSANFVVTYIDEDACDLANEIDLFVSRDGDLCFFCF